MIWALVLLLAAAAVLAFVTMVGSRRRPAAPGEFVVADGVRLHFVSRGSGRAVVFLHGNDATHLDFRLSILDRAAEEFRAIAFDRPGHGYSERGRGSGSVLRQAALLRAALAKLGVEKPILAGQSWSGYLALAYALTYPEETGGVVLLAPAAYPAGSGFFRDPRFLTLLPGVGLPLWVCLAPLARPLIRRAMARSFSPAPVSSAWLEAVEPFQVWSAQHVRAAAEDYLAPSRDMPPLVARYGGIRAPVAIVAGDADISVPPERHAYRLAREIPEARLVRLPGAGHMLQFTHPDAVMEAIRGIGQAATGAT